MAKHMNMVGSPSLVGVLVPGPPKTSAVPVAFFMSAQGECTRYPASLGLFTLQYKKLQTLTLSVLAWGPV